MKISIIVPVLDEAGSIEEQLKKLQGLRALGHELIVVDGGSRDGTAKIAQPLVDKLCLSDRGRAKQMNHGASQAKGDVLLFLHSDTCLPARSEQLIEHAINSLGGGCDQSHYKYWGRFCVRLSNPHWVYQLISKCINWRTALTSVCTGDQAIFVNRQLFSDLGGYAEIRLMEDVQLSKRLRKISKPICIRQVVITSSRRWESQGLVSTVFLMWRLRLAYFMGTDPDDLVKIYYPNNNAQATADVSVNTQMPD